MLERVNIGVLQLVLTLGLSSGLHVAVLGSMPGGDGALAESEAARTSRVEFETIAREPEPPPPPPPPRPNGAAMLFTSAKINHLNVLPQGAPERETRVLDMVAQMDEEGLGGCTLAGECATACPKGIPLVSMTGMNK